MARQTKAEKAAEAKRLRDELEQIEAVPVVTHPDVPKDQVFLVPADVAEAVIAAGGTTTGTIGALIAQAGHILPPRGDEVQRTLAVSLLSDDNGRDSVLRIEGAGIGGHTGYIRVWPDDQLHSITFDGDTFEQTLRFVATHAIVVIDDSDEIRVGDAPTD